MGNSALAGRIAAVVVVVLALVAVVFAGPAGAEKARPVSASSGQGPPQEGFWPAFSYSRTQPMASPAGTEDFSCLPQPGRNPVVLVHGTLANAYATWALFGPALRRAGYCVFAPNYGGGQGPAWANGLGPIADSATQFGGYVERVVAATGASAIDVVAHSQGGPMVRQWMKYGGGADFDDSSRNKIGKLITFGSTHNGTTLSGTTELIAQLTRAAKGNSPGSALTAGAARDQARGSAFMTELTPPSGCSRGCSTPSSGRATTR